MYMYTQYIYIYIYVYTYVCELLAGFQVVPRRGRNEAPANAATELALTSLSLSICCVRI